MLPSRRTQSDKELGDNGAVQMGNWVLNLGPWEWFATFTFEGEWSCWSAMKAFESFMRREYYWVEYFYAVEPNPNRWGHHVHAIFKNCGRAGPGGSPLRRDAMWAKWYEERGYGRARIEPVRGHMDVADYCAKYVTKELAWWNVRMLKRPNDPNAAVKGAIVVMAPASNS